MLVYQFKAFINTEYLFIYKIKTDYLVAVDEIIFNFKNPELRTALLSISPIKSSNPRRRRSFFYIFKRYEPDWIVDRYVFSEAFKKLVKEV